MEDSDTLARVVVSQNEDTGEMKMESVPLPALVPLEAQSLTSFIPVQQIGKLEADGGTLHIISRHGIPPLLPKSYEEAKRWARGRKVTPLGRCFKWKLIRFDDGYRRGFIVRDGNAVVDCWLEGVELRGPFIGARPLRPRK